MNNLKKIASFLIISLLTLSNVSCRKDNANNTTNSDENQEYFAVANRGSNTITFHNTDNLTLLGTTTLPNGTQPTYVAYSKERNKIYTGGLQNGILYEINSETFAVERSIDVGVGAFHLWLNDTADQLWVNNIGSEKTTTVVDLSSFSVEQKIELPTNLNLSSNAVQHDVIIQPEGNYAYVTILDGENKSHLLQYKTSDFSMVNSLEFGGDGHLGFFNNSLYTLSQVAGSITQHNSSTLEELGTTSFSGAHGVAASENNLFVTDKPNNRLGVLNTENTIISTVSTSHSGTHNVAVNEIGTKLIVAYSGGSQTKVELFDVNNGELTLNATLDSGTNPFGVAYIKK